jgi:aminoglycoside phosphotransferase (APT) family kinase protein
VQRVGGDRILLGVPMHPGQLDVTTDLVTRLIRSQFPEWGGLRVRGVRSHGTVNALFRIGDDLVARFPILPGDPAAALKELEQEADAARRLRAISPYPTPEPIAIGEPGEGYPLPWAVYTWISGTIAYDADVAGSAAFAEDLATFVRALRSVPTDGRTFTVADPAIDLAPAWNLLDAEARTAFRTALGSDDDEWRRGMGWSFAQAIGCLWYYVDTNPVMSRTAHHTLTALLAAA